jgi:hypothetical protein
MEMAAEPAMAEPAEEAEEGAAVTVPGAGPMVAVAATAEGEATEHEGAATAEATTARLSKKAQVLHVIPTVPPVSPRRAASGGSAAHPKQGEPPEFMKTEVVALRKLKTAQSQHIAKLEAENRSLRQKLRCMPRVAVERSTPRSGGERLADDWDSSTAPPRAAFTAPVHVRHHLERLRQDGIGRVVELRVGRPSSAVSSAGSSATRSLDRLKLKLEREGYTVLVRHAAGMGEGSIFVECLGEVVGKSTCKAVGTNSEIARLATLAAEAHAKRAKSRRTDAPASPRGGGSARPSSADHAQHTSKQPAKPPRRSDSAKSKTKWTSAMLGAKMHMAAVGGEYLRVGS